MSQHPRIFTHAEASALIPWLRSRMQELQVLKQERDAGVLRLVGMTQAMRANGSAIEGALLEARVEELVAEMQSLADEIAGAGIEIKDIDRGLVDFPALRGGRVVYLCWLIEEQTIAYWHELDAGFAGRQAFEPDGWKSADDTLDAGNGRA